MLLEDAQPASQIIDRDRTAVSEKDTSFLIGLSVVFVLHNLTKKSSNKKGEA
jgi:hypothetical protein